MSETRINADAVLAHWHSLCANYDNSLAEIGTRQFLAGLGQRDLPIDDRLKIIADRVEEYPHFFETYDYDWTLEKAAYEFPNEILLQSRCIDAAIGFWLNGKNTSSSQCRGLGSIVGRTTYLANFDQVTPHVQHHASLEFVIVPLGWQEFCHRYLSSFETFVDASSCEPLVALDACRPTWLNLAANLVASNVCNCDYFLISMIESIQENIDLFTSAASDFKESDVKNRASELCFAAQDFAFCHEIAHVIHGETGANRNRSQADELRADRGALAAYKASWGFRPALLWWVSTDPRVQVLIGPIVFSFLNRVLVCSRKTMRKKLFGSERETRGSGVLNELSDRSRAMVAQLPALRKSDPSVDLSRSVALVQTLMDFEANFAKFLANIPEQDCKAAAKIAKATQKLCKSELSELRRSRNS